MPGRRRPAPGGALGRWRQAPAGSLGRRLRHGPGRPLPGPGAPRHQQGAQRRRPGPPGQFRLPRRGPALHRLGDPPGADSAEEDGAGHRLRCEFGIIKEVLPAPGPGAPRSPHATCSPRFPPASAFSSPPRPSTPTYGRADPHGPGHPAVHWCCARTAAASWCYPRWPWPAPAWASAGRAHGRAGAFREGERPWSLYGYVSPPELSFRDRNHLYLFVNGRAVRDRLLLAALAEGWEGFFPKAATRLPSCSWTFRPRRWT